MGLLTTTTGATGILGTISILGVCQMVPKEPTYFGQCRDGGCIERSFGCNVILVWEYLVVYCRSHKTLVMDVNDVMIGGGYHQGEGTLRIRKCCTKQY